MQMVAGREAFSTPEVSIPGDVSVFRNGTLAISDQSNSIVLYSQNGTFQGNITHPILDTGSPFGNDMGPDDTLWVALIGNGMARFSRNGPFWDHSEPGFSVREMYVSIL